MPDADPHAISVVTPSFEQGRFIARTVRSVLDQEAERVELMVVDGGSGDETVEVLRRFGARLRWVSERDRGQAHAVNKGIRATSGEIIGWLNSDDVYTPGCLAAVRAFFAAHPEVDVVYGEADHIDEADRVIERYPTEPWDAERLRERCFICQPATFFRRRVVERHGLLDERLQLCLDYEYWLRLAAGGARFAHLRRTLAGSRLHGSTKTLGQRLAVHREINDMLRRHFGRVPDRWLSNYAHAVLERLGLERGAAPRTFAIAVSLLSWAAALRWNRGISRALRQVTWGWITGSFAEVRAEPQTMTPRAPSRRPPAPEGALVIGFDVSQTGEGKAGCGHQAAALLAALVAVDGGHEYRLLPTFGADFWDPDGARAACRAHLADRVRWGPSPADPAAARELWSASGSELDARLGHPDVVHAHNFFCPTGLKRARLVYTLYDLAFLAEPGWTTEENRLICFEGVFDASLEADLVIAVSESSRRHFLETFPHYPAERVVVVYLASRFPDRAVARPPGLEPLADQGFVLSVGTLEPRKNTRRLLRAYGRFTAARRDALPLVLTGGSGWLSGDFARWVAEFGLAGRVRHLGYVDDASLHWLYRSCAAFLYPSLHEGFGLPVVEAMSQGAAVLTSNTSSLPEVAGDAALLVDPIDEEAIAAALERLCDDVELRFELRRRARLQASRFSWRRAARETLELYHRAVAMPKLSRE